MVGLSLMHRTMKTIKLLCVTKQPELRTKHSGNMTLSSPVVPINTFRAGLTYMKALNQFELAIMVLLAYNLPRQQLITESVTGTGLQVHSTDVGGLAEITTWSLQNVLILK